MVRFADVLGLDLAAVRHFLDEVPRVPPSAYEDLSVGPAAPPTIFANFDSYVGQGPSDGLVQEFQVSFLNWPLPNLS